MKELQSLCIILLLLTLSQIDKRCEILACGQLRNTLEPHLKNTYQATHRWPWHVAIYHQANDWSPVYYQCGGTLISSDSVLTAAHCVPLEAEQISVSLGRLNLDAAESSAPFIKVSEIIKHPNFSAENNENDIAIIKLLTPATFNNYVQPICLWKPDKTDLSEIVGKSGTVIGWGTTETGEVSNGLREAALRVVTSLSCLRSNRDLFGRYLSDTNFCAGFRNGTNVCQGDSGGSMSFEENGIYYIRGIVSVGMSKPDSGTQEMMCDATQYAVFTDVAQYLQWIRHTAKILEYANHNDHHGVGHNSGHNNHGAVQNLGPRYATTSAVDTIDWAGFQWSVRDEDNSRPGPNNWRSENVWIDSINHLHLKLAHGESGWSSAELYSKENFGFGTYRWYVEGPIDRFDPNVVLGLFTYGTVDAIDEIEITIAKFGRTEPNASNLFYTAYPRAFNTTNPSSKELCMTLQGTYTTHQFKWTEDYVSFQIQYGFQDSPTKEVYLAYRTPSTFKQHMPILGVPIHMNLYAFDGKPPIDEKEVEIIIHDFQYTK